MPSPEQFADEALNNYAQEYNALPTAYSQDNTFTYEQQPTGVFFQDPRYVYGNQGYVQHGNHESFDAGKHNVEDRTEGGVNKLNGGGKMGDGVIHQPSPHYHSTALKAESPEEKGVTAQVPLNDGSPQRCARRSGSRAQPFKYTHSSAEEDADNSDDGDYVEQSDEAEADIETKDLKKAKDSPQGKS